MATDFSSLKKQRSSFSNLMVEIEKIQQPQAEVEKDDRFWSLEVDKAGNGYAIIRFLPPPKGEDIPWVRIWNHSFKGPTGKWYIENSLTTLGQPDPVSELNTELWNSGLETDKAIARERKRKLVYISNILVIKDPAHPENNGKVKLFRYGKKIFDKIKDIMKPEFEDETPINPFDFWEGATFHLKATNVEGYRNYDKSKFAASSPLSKDVGIEEEEFEQIWNREYSLQEFLDPKHFKSYDALKAKLAMVLTGAPTNTDTYENTKAPEKEESFSKPVARSRTAESADIDEDDSLSYFTKIDEDDSLSYFTKLANDD